MGGAFREEIFKVNDDRDDTKDYDDYDDYDDGGARTESGSIEGTFKLKMTRIIFGAHYPGDCIARRRWVMSEKAMVTSLF